MNLFVIIPLMKNIFHHVTRHAKTVGQHVKKHHKKYLLGIFGGFAVAKMFILFVAGVGVLNYSHNTFADQDTGCVMTGQYYTGEVEECSVITGYYTGGTEECTTIEGYYTGGTLDESGNLVDQTYIDPVTGCVMTGQYYTGETQECITLSGYRTGGTSICTTGDVQQITGDDSADQTGGFINPDAEEMTGICTADDFQWLTPASGAFIRGTSTLSWSYLTPDCTASGNVQLLTLQLYDHNHQWISLATISSLATGYNFDTLLLSGYTNASGLVTSGMYTVADASGVVLFTGVATGTYIDFATGYTVRLLDSTGNVLTTGNIFSIDNSVPTLTGIALTSTGALSGMVGLNSQVVLNFTASETLSGVTVLIGGTGAAFVSKSGLIYTYSQILNSGFAQGAIVYTLVYTDFAGNTGLVTGTGALIFDKTAPVVSGMTLTGTSLSGLTLSFVTSELADFAFNYAQSGATAISWTGTEYTTGHEYMFTGIQENVGYSFRLQADDLVGNRVMYSGSFLVSTTGVVSFVYAIYSGETSTGTILTLGKVLKEEINKFNVCKASLSYTGINLTINKNLYTLHMPEFKKDYVKKIVNAFTLLVLDKVEKNKRLTKGEITEITDKFNSFLIVLNLTRDGDNACKQSFSNYHISQFKRALDEYGIYFK